MFYISAMPGLPLALLLLFTVKEEPPVKPEPVQSEDADDVPMLDGPVKTEL